VSLIPSRVASSSLVAAESPRAAGIGPGMRDTPKTDFSHEKKMRGGFVLDRKSVHAKLDLLSFLLL
jgi:hypothetical protein